MCPKSQRKNKRAEKTVPQSTEIHASSEKSRNRQPFPPYKIYVASHVEVSSANAVPGGFARAPFHDPASALYPPPLPRGPMGTTHPPIIHTSGHLVPPPRRSARGQAGLLFLLLHMGVFFPSPRDDKKGGDFKVFNRATSQCCTSMYSYTFKFRKSTFEGFPVFVDSYPFRGTLRRVVFLFSAFFPFFCLFFFFRTHRNKDTRN